MESEGFVSLKHLAEMLGMDRSALLKYVKKRGFKTHRRRTPDSSNQRSSVVTSKDAELIMGEREEQGFISSGKVMDSGTGVFYVIQLVPEYDPKRVKMGFAGNLDERLAEHKTAAPTAVVLKYWPCKRTWEYTAMDYISSANCRLIQGEVFECDDLDALQRRADEFFGLLPDPDKELELSEYSPLNG